MMRLVGIGDSHFGPGPRNVERYASLDQIIAWGTARPIGAWLHAGDLNHAKMTIEDRNELVPRFQRMADHAPVCMVVGNHDVDGDCRVFSKLQAKFPIVVIETPGVHRIELATGGHASVFGVPYVHRGGLVAAGVDHAQLAQVARQILDPIFLTGANQLETAAAAGDLPVFLAHLAVGGALMSTGQPSIGREIEIDPALLARLGPVPKVLGHIHRHQQIYDAWYLGSIAKNDFGENEDKVFGVLDFESPTVWSIHFERLTVPEQLLIEGRLTRDGFQFDHDDWMCRSCVGTGDGVVEVADDGVAPCRPCNGSGRRSWDGAYVKVSYRYNHSERDVLDVALVRSQFAGCRDLKLDPIAEMEHSVRSPEIAAAVTLLAKGEAYCAHRGVAFTDGLGAKIDALQQQSSEEILAALRTRIDGMGKPPSPTTPADAERQVA